MVKQTRLQGRRYRGLVGVCLLGLIGGAVGCQPKPARRYELRQIEMGLLAANVPSPESNTYKILQDKRTVGRFPCGLAVMRVTASLPDTPADAGKLPEGALVIDLPNDVQAVPWSELLDNLPPVTTVKVMGRPSVTFKEVTVDELVQAGKRQHAALVLIYGRNDLPDDRIEMVGAMYDTESRQLVAVVNARVEPVPGLSPPPDRLKEDRRHEDPVCLTVAKFQDLVLRCIDELVRLDNPATTTQPNPWDRPEVQPMRSPWTSPHGYWVIPPAHEVRPPGQQ